MAVTNPEAESRHQRASQIIVPLDTPGFHIERNIAVMGEAHGGWNSHSGGLVRRRARAGGKSHR